MKKLLTGFLATALLFSMSTGVLAQPNTELVDGRNGNSEKNGSFDVVITDGPYYTGEKATITVENLVIDGPMDTLVVTGDGEVVLPSTPGEYTYEVTATTFFKNGKKDGQIHTQITNSVTVTVVEKPSSQLPVATSLHSEWNAQTNEKNTVRVYYIITINGVTISHHVNFNHADRATGQVEVEKDGYKFIVKYLQP